MVVSIIFKSQKRNEKLFRRLLLLMCVLPTKVCVVIGCIIFWICLKNHWLTHKLNEQVKGTGTLKFLKRKSKLFHSTIEYVYLVLSTKKIMIGSFFQNVRLLSQERAQSQMVRRTNSILKLFFVGLNTNFPLCIVMRYGWRSSLEFWRILGSSHLLE